MTRKLLMTAAAAIVLVASIGIGNAEANDRGFPGGFIHGGVIRDMGIHHEVLRHRFIERQGFPAIGFGDGDFTDYADPDAAAEAPSIINVPQPAPAVLAVDRPPCHETTEAWSSCVGHRARAGRSEAAKGGGGPQGGSPSRPAEAGAAI